jgi:hypothetical protein
MSDKLSLSLSGYMDYAAGAKPVEDLGKTIQVNAVTDGTMKLTL